MNPFVILVAVLLSVQAATVPPVVSEDKVNMPLSGHKEVDTEVPAVVVEVSKHHKHNSNEAVPEVMITTIMPMVDQVPEGAMAKDHTVAKVAEMVPEVMMTTVKPDDKVSDVVVTKGTPFVDPVRKVPDVMVTTAKPLANVVSEVKVPVPAPVVKMSETMPTVASHVMAKKDPVIVVPLTVSPVVKDTSDVKDKMEHVIKRRSVAVHVPGVVVTTVKPKVDEVSGVSTDVPVMVKTPEVKPVVNNVMDIKMTKDVPVPAMMVKTTNVIDPKVDDVQVAEVVVTTVNPMENEVSDVVMMKAEPVVPVTGQPTISQGLPQTIINAIVKSLSTSLGGGHAINRRSVDLVKGMVQVPEVMVTTVKPAVVDAVVKNGVTVGVVPVPVEQNVNQVPVKGIPLPVVPSNVKEITGIIEIHNTDQEIKRRSLDVQAPEVMVTTVKSMTEEVPEVMMKKSKVPVVVPVPVQPVKDVTVTKVPSVKFPEVVVTTVKPMVNEVHQVMEKAQVPVIVHEQVQPFVNPVMVTKVPSVVIGGPGHSVKRRSVDAENHMVHVPLEVSTKDHKVNNDAAEVVVNKDQPLVAADKVPIPQVIVTTVKPKVNKVPEVMMKGEPVVVAPVSNVNQVSPVVDHIVKRRSLEMVTTEMPVQQSKMVTTVKPMVKDVTETMETKEKVSVPKVMVTTVKPNLVDINGVIVKDVQEIPNVHPVLFADDAVKEVVPGVVHINEKSQNDVLPPILHRPHIKDEAVVPHVPLSPPITEDVKDSESSEEDESASHHHSEEDKKDNHHQKIVTRQRRAQPFWDKNDLVTAKPKLETDPKVIANILAKSKSVKLNHRAMRSVTDDNAQMIPNKPAINHQTKAEDAATSHMDPCDLLCTKFEIDPVCATNGLCLHEFPNQCMLETYNCRHPKNKFVATRDQRCLMSWLDFCKEIDLD
uniref:Kazal-like domain-containing protein n=1 Tax=Stomoxys calcitrans TaxID=35570 RepID=A0A1I8PJF5_STOCA